jgi:hypothetical protein
MKIRAILGALVLASLPAMPALAENMTPEDIKKLVDEAVEKRLQEHERREGGMQPGQGEAAASPQYPVAIRSHHRYSRRSDRARKRFHWGSDPPDPANSFTPSPS